MTCEVIDPQPPDPQLPAPPRPPAPPQPLHWQPPRWLLPVNLVLGVWLFFSAFKLPATEATGSQLNSLFVAVMIVGASIITRFAPRARWVTMGLAVWLLVWKLLASTRPARPSTTNLPRNQPGSERSCASRRAREVPSR